VWQVWELALQLLAQELSELQQLREQLVASALVALLSQQVQLGLQVQQEQLAQYCEQN
jgi:hypothetical protein